MRSVMLQINEYDDDDDDMMMTVQLHRCMNIRAKAGKLSKIWCINSVVLQTAKEKFTS